MRILPVAAAVVSGFCFSAPMLVPSAGAQSAGTQSAGTQSAGTQALRNAGEGLLTAQKEGAANAGR